MTAFLCYETAHSFARVTNTSEGGVCFSLCIPLDYRYLIHLNVHGHIGGDDGRGLWPSSTPSPPTLLTE